MPMTAIPQTLAPFFQEYSLSDLDSDRAASTVIERTLQFGNREEIRWLFGRYPRKQILDWLSGSGPERLPEPHLTFWKFLLDA